MTDLSEGFIEINELAKDEINAYQHDLMVAGIQNLFEGETIRGAIKVINKTLQFVPSSIISSDELSTFLKDGLKKMDLILLMIHFLK